MTASENNKLDILRSTDKLPLISSLKFASGVLMQVQH